MAFFEKLMDLKHDSIECDKASSFFLGSGMYWLFSNMKLLDRSWL